MHGGQHRFDEKPSKRIIRFTGMNMTLFTSCFAAMILSLAATVPSPVKGELFLQTHTYKTAGELKIQADVYRPDDAQSRPVLVWLHGGALVMGSRKDVPEDLRNLCRAQGYCLVSADYRLAPQVKLPQIIEDLQDFMKWV